MQRNFLMFILITLLVGAIGCAGLVNYQAPVVPPRTALIETYKAPLMTDFNYTNVGKGNIIKASSSKTLYFWDFLLTRMNFSWDDVSIPEIARKGGIKNITYADYEVVNILGVYAHFQINVYGY